ncbi:hypothetical protein AB0E04_43580 [Streptomyces sp. NPDC048251]
MAPHNGTTILKAATDFTAEAESDFGCGSSCQSACSNSTCIGG